MNLLSLYRIILGRWLIIVISVASCLTGGLLVLKYAPKQYRATAQVVLQVFKADPITGFTVSKDADVYVATQMRLLRDYQTSGLVVDDLGWAQSPELLAEYDARDPGDPRDFRHWAADRISNGIVGAMVRDSNVLEIGYTSSSRDFAKTVVESIRKAYVASNSAGLQTGAAAQAQEFGRRRDEIQARLIELQKQKSELEKEAGIFMQTDRVDIDATYLRRLLQSTVALQAPSGRTRTASNSALHDMDAKLASMNAQLGPNNPAYIDLKRNRDQLAGQVSAEQGAVRATQNLASSQNEQIGKLSAKLLENSDKLLQLKMVQDEIDDNRKNYDDASAKIVSGTQLSTAGGNQVTPIGSVNLQTTPIFPNPLIILSGTAVLGLMTGVLFSLLVEFQGRFVRGRRDLETASGAPVLGIVPLANAQKRQGFRWPPLRRNATA